MTRYKAIISYDGYAFAGFQRQPHARSVQEEIEKTLTKLNKGQKKILFIKLRNLQKLILIVTFL